MELDKMKYYVGNGLNDKRMEERVKAFERLPLQAQILFFKALFAGVTGECSLPDMLYVYSFDGAYGSCESPIEQVFYVALGIAKGMRTNDMTVLGKDGNIVCSCADTVVYPQYRIDTNDHTYYADFLIEEEYSGDEIDGYVQDEDIVIECDGYDYHHADKTQVAHDYDRENDIKTAGYSMLRFTGSQIFNDPMKCANSVIEYLIAGMKHRHNEFLKEEKEDGR